MNSLFLPKMNIWGGNLGLRGMRIWSSFQYMSPMQFVLCYYGCVLQFPLVIFSIIYVFVGRRQEEYMKSLCCSGELAFWHCPFIISVHIFLCVFVDLLSLNVLPVFLLLCISSLYHDRIILGSSRFPLHHLFDQTPL